MSFAVRLRKSWLLWSLVVGATTVLLLTTALAKVASAHGAVIDPPTRNYGCLERWRNNHMAPEMRTEDPMCYEAYRVNPNAMWNWNAVFRENVRGNHQAAIPDGTLCSAGNTDGGRYDFLDTPGPWIAKPVNNSFTLRLFDQASHGADYIWVYVTKQGFDPLTQRLRWSDLERVAVVGNTPASQWRREVDGVSIDIPVNAPGRTGRHMVYTIWQASHMDQSYYLCSDVIFPGGSEPTVPPTTPPTVPPTTPPTTPPTVPPTTPPTTPSPGQPVGGCVASYRITASWSGGFQGEVTVTAGNVALNGWAVTMTFPDGQRITQAWNAEISVEGSTVTARNASYNGQLSAGASTTFGFLASGSAGTPAVSCRAL